MAEDLNALSDEDFRARWRAWLDANYPDEWKVPVIFRLAGDDQRKWHRMCWEAGWRAPGLPKEFGGLGLSLAKQLIYNEEMDAIRAARVLDTGGVLLTPVLMEYGTQEQRDRYFGPILRGEELWCQGYSEPGSGSDLASLRTSAVLDGDHFVINGQKIWTTLAGPADHIFVLVRTNKEVRKQAGISFILADMKTPGITVRPIMNLAGEDELCEIFFDNVRVPAENLVGGIDQGWNVAKSLLGDERILNGAPTLAHHAFAMLEQLVDGMGLAGDQGVADRQAALLCQLMDVESLYRQVADAAVRGVHDNAALSLMKVLATDLFQRISEEMLTIAAEHGGDHEPVGIGGVDSDLRKVFMVARPSSIYAGANEVQRNIISRILLGAPTR